MVLLAYTPHPERDPQLGRLWKGGISVAQNKLLSPLSLGPKPGRGLRPHWAGALGPPGGGSAVPGTDSQDGESLHLGRMFSWFRKTPPRCHCGQPQKPGDPIPTSWGLPRLVALPVGIWVLGDREAQGRTGMGTWSFLGPHRSSAEQTLEGRWQGRDLGQGWGWAGDIMKSTLPVPS